MVGAGNVIGRIFAATGKTRDGTECPPGTHDSAKVEPGPPPLQVTVFVTRDGIAAEELRFDHVPTLGELVAVAGASARMFAIGMIECPQASRQGAQPPPAGAAVASGIAVSQASPIETTQARPLA